MTTNIDRAAEVIADALRPAFSIADGIGHDLARILADAGLLAPDLPEPTMDMADPHLAVWESGVTVHREVVYVPHFLPLDDVGLVEQTGMDLLAAAAHVRKQVEK